METLPLSTIETSRCKESANCIVDRLDLERDVVVRFSVAILPHENPQRKRLLRRKCQSALETFKT